jgi:hypothetical protein
MRSRRIPAAVLLPRKLEGRSESCGTCFTARRLTSIGSFMKWMKGGKRCGCSQSATAREDGSGGRMLHELCREIASAFERVGLKEALSGYPITISFARRVGMLMTELSHNQTPNPSYRFYM